MTTREAVSRGAEFTARLILHGVEPGRAALAAYRHYDEIVTAANDDAVAALARQVAPAHGGKSDDEPQQQPQPTVSSPTVDAFLAAQAKRAATVKNPLLPGDAA
jgi:hypothetical protein